MKRLFLILVTIIGTLAAASAKNWCETLISNLNSRPEVDKTMAVNRAPDTHEITHATYSYRIKSKKLYRQIFNTLKSHAAESDYYSETGGKYSTILLRFTDKGRQWSCKAQGNGSNNQFLVTVKSDGSSDETVINSRDIEKARKQAEDAYRQAADARKKAEEARQQAAEARRQAAESRRQASQSKRKSTTRSSGSNTTIILNEESSTHKAEVSDHEQALRQAAARRQQLLK